MTGAETDIAGSGFRAVAAARRSVRRYDGRAVPPATLERLIAAASRAPSAHNRQPWRFVVLEAAASKARLAEAMAARLIAERTADGDPPEVIAADAARSRARIGGAPVVILACLDATTEDAWPDTRRKKAEHLMAVQGVAAAIQTLLLAAAADGLAAAWLCAPLFCPDVVRATLALPATWEPQAAITLGFPAAPPPDRPRLPLTAIARFVDR